MSRSGCVQPMALVPPGKRIHKALRASQNLSFLFIVFSYIQPYAVVDNLYCSSRVVINSHKCLFLIVDSKYRMYSLYCILTISPDFRSEANLWKVNLLISTEGFGSLWTQRVSPICISTSVSHDLVYPVKADLLSVVLFQEVFWHSCVCVCLHDGLWRLIRFLPLHSWPVWHNRQSRCLGSTQGIRRSSAESN